ncbi:MAG: MFS transporter [Candidatus Nanopelagicales bacterium]
MTAIQPERTQAIDAVDVPAVQRRSLAVLSSAQVLGSLAVAGAVAAGALIAAGVSGSEAAAGLAQTFGVVGAAIMALPLARLALSRGRRASLAAGYGIGALGCLVVISGAIWWSLPLVYVGCLLVGVATAAGFQARYAATDLATENTRGRSLSIVVWAGTIGAVAGPNLLEVSGRLALSMGLPQLAGPYIVGGVALAGATIVLLVFLRPDPYVIARAKAARASIAAAAEVAHPRLRDGIAHLRNNRTALLGVSTIAIGHVAMVSVMVMTPIHMAHVDVTLQLIGLVISVHVAGMYALSPVVGWAVDRFGRIPVIVVGIVILLAACAISGLAAGDDITLLGVGLFLLGLGWSCTLIAGSTLLVDGVAPQERPSVQGLSDLVMNVAGAVGGAVAGLVVLFSSYAVLCVVAMIPVLGLAVFTAACRPRSNKRSV